MGQAWGKSGQNSLVIIKKNLRKLMERKYHPSQPGIELFYSYTCKSCNIKFFMMMMKIISTSKSPAIFAQINLSVDTPKRPKLGQIIPKLKNIKTVSTIILPRP
jgi:hypothetical protein